MIKSVLPVLFILFVVACSKPDIPPSPPRPVKTLKLADAKDPTFRVFYGTVAAADRADVSFRISGSIIEVLVQPGDKVELDDVIARIDDRDYKNREAATQAKLESLKAQEAALKAGARPEDIARLESLVAAASSEFERYKVEAVRLKELLDKGLLSQSEYDTATTKRDVAAEQLNAAKKELEIGKIGARKEELDRMRADIAAVQSELEAAKDAVTDTELRSPYSGMVTQRYLDAGVNVQA